MCGFSLIVGNKSDQIKTDTELSQKYFQHRGPDSSSLLLIEKNAFHLGFSHNRLSILGGDIANQPHHDTSTGNILLFNGEIYNFKNLITHYGLNIENTDAALSDTQVLALLLSKFEFNEIIKNLRGMFSIVYFRNDESEIWVARDSFGTKPLYYSVLKDRFVISSEVGFINVINDKPIINKDALCKNIIWGCNFGEETIYDGVFSIGVAQTKVFDLYGTEIHTGYINCLASSSEDTKITTPNIKGLWEEAIHRTMVSDAPIAMLLSGGLDSSAIAISVKKLGYKAHCFHLRSSGPISQETLACRKLAADLGFALEEITLTESLLNESFWEYVSCSDYPSDDGFNTFIATKIVKSAGYKVLLHGVGGDELFGGYRSRQLLPKMRYLIPITRRLNFLKRFQILEAPKWNKLLNLLSSKSIKDSYLILRQINDPFTVKRRFGYSIKKNFFHSSKNQAKATNAYLKTSMLETTFYCADKLLKDGDFYAMQNSIEVRFPILDYDFYLGAFWHIKKNKFSKFTKYEVWNSIINNFPGYLDDVKKTGFTLNKTFKPRKKSGLTKKKPNNELYKFVTDFFNSKFTKRQNVLHFGSISQVEVIKNILRNICR